MAAILFGVLLTFNIVEAAGPQLNRDLSFGIVGTDVLSLQQFLNGNGYTVAPAVRVRPAMKPRITVF